MMLRLMFFLVLLLPVYAGPALLPFPNSRSSSPISTHGAGPLFEFERDTLAFPNELLWHYQFQPGTGALTVERRDPRPDYALRCFPLARSVKQFFNHARFEAGPVESEEFYRERVREVVRRNPRAASPPNERVVIPGYPDLRAFSLDHESLLKETLGRPWQSYLQRGNWRMVFPFPRGQQARAAERLEASIRENGVAVVHLVRFPDLTLNHAILLYQAAASDSFLTFMAYDPNSPEAPVQLYFDHQSRRFLFPGNSYFGGGPVSVYEVYHAVCY